MKSSPEVVRQQTQGNPLMAGAIAFGVGVLTASVFKPTEIEKQAAGQLMDKAEPLTEELKETGQETVEHLKEPASPRPSRSRKRRGRRRRTSPIRRSSPPRPASSPRSMSQIRFAPRQRKNVRPLRRGASASADGCDAPEIEGPNSQ